MTAFLIGIVIILVTIILIQYRFIINRNANLKYIHKKLNNILANNTSERLLVLTDDQELKSFLIDINNLLDYNQKTIANHMKMERSMKKMLSNISHDLKTPLTVVLGYIEAIQLDESIGYEERRELLSKVKNKAIEVVELINKFFDLAKLESGDKELLLTRLNINEVLRKNILGFYDTLTAKGFEVIINIPNKDIYVLGNEEALHRILNNLISNAIKHGGEGKIIGLDLKQDENFAYIDVWDKGKGINEIHKDRIFERMYTVEDSRNKSYEGSGIGLTITKRLIERLEGDILLYSKAYEKTVFSVKLKRMTY